MAKKEEETKQKKNTRVNFTRIVYNEEDEDEDDENEDEVKMFSC